MPRARRAAPRPRRLRRTGVALGLLFVTAAPATAEVVRVVIDRREPVLGGQAFGAAGAYEKIVGRVFFEFDPRSPANAAIVDLHLAPLNGAGKVEAWADVVVLQPANPSKRRGVAWLEVSNRGGKASLRYFNRAPSAAADPSAAEDFGDGLLLRQGLTVIWVGWQWDVPEREGLLRLHVPAARAGGGPVTGLVRADWTVDEATPVLDLGHRGHRAYPPLDPAGPENVLTVRSGRLAPREVVPRERWRFVAGRGGGDGRPTWIELEGGFEAGRIYEIVYRAAEPRIVGLGLAAVRDVMAYSRNNLRSEFPTEKGIAFGVSQTGRFLRHFLYQGFNTDEQGRKVFDGMLVHSAGAGRGSFNHRFAQPSRDAHRYSAFFYPTDLFPFASRLLSDPVTGAEDGLLRRTREDHRPYVFYTNSGYEYWGRAASLIHTTADGLADVLPLPQERIYHLAGGQHSVGAFPPPGGSEVPGTPAYRGNPLDFLLVLRALAVRLVEWVDEGTEPPPSHYPKLSEGTLVPPAAVAFPRVPGVASPRVIHEAYRADYGPRFADSGIVDVEPPVLGPAFPSLAPQVDGLGNELSGIRTVELRVPVATYAPWHVRTGMAGGEGELSDFVGTLIPLPANEEERARTGDPRPSLEALHGTKQVYMRRVVGAVQDLVSSGLLLPEDVGAATERAQALWDWAVARVGASAPTGH